MTPHGIDRSEWVLRFHARIADLAINPDSEKLTPEAAAEISGHEIESWPEHDDTAIPDWQEVLPEDAADEQMGNWIDDEES